MRAGGRGGPGAARRGSWATAVGWGGGLSRVELEASVTPRRLAELARYGMGADVAQLKRHGDARPMATLAATAAQLEATATDDALELLELLMATELTGTARQEADKETVKRHPGLAPAAATPAVVAWSRPAPPDPWGEGE